MRGQRLYTSLFETEPVETQKIASLQVKKGRSQLLIDKRNECLLDRYYYYGKLCGLKYSQVIKHLSNEFFLSTSFVITIITSHSAVLSHYATLNPTRKDLQTKWPFINFN